jgi:transcription antitermination factor NusG
MINGTSQKWYAIYVASRSEKKVNELLSEKGIHVYLPLVRSLRIWSDRKKMVEFPLMNGYVFVNINIITEKDKVLQTRGVVNFVRSEGKVAVIRDVEISRLKQIVELGYDIESDRMAQSYNEGDKIKIIAGPLKGLEGYIINSDSGKNFEIVLESIHQTVRVKLPEEILAPAKK